MASGRGGKRAGAGRPSKWQSGSTIAIRVPKQFAQELQRIAVLLDRGGSFKVTALKPKIVEPPGQEGQLVLDLLDLVVPTGEP